MDYVYLLFKSKKGEKHARMSFTSLMKNINILRALCLIFAVYETFFKT